jgi:N-acetylglucosamine-6-phosphate deacetylase
MSAAALVNARVLTDAGLVDGHAVIVEGGRIADVVAVGDERVASARRHDLAGALLLPGFVDVQVNGGGGVLFNDAPDAATLRAIGAAHRRHGTTAFMPTVISDAYDVIERAIGAVRDAIAAKVPGVAGIHIEGPFINPERRGAHDAAKIRGLDEKAFDLLTSLGVGRTMVTLAPEATTPAMIRRLADAGVIVCAGHTNGTFAATTAAFASGVRGVTHLFNAMSPLTSREPGVVGAALADPDCWCGIIVDGRHVHAATLKLALAAKRHERFMLVTDAMPCVGGAPGPFMLQGRRIEVRDGVCVDAEGVLSGSALDMASAVRNALGMLGLALPEAVRMASTYPAEFLGLGAELGRIARGYRANFVVADDRLRVSQAWIDGDPLDIPR